MIKQFQTIWFNRSLSYIATIIAMYHEQFD